VQSGLSACIQANPARTTGTVTVSEGTSCMCRWRLIEMLAKHSDVVAFHLLPPAITVVCCCVMQFQ
jgi:hypothetical protein